jgi:DTW domain-containing protein YfiP
VTSSAPRGFRQQRCAGCGLTAELCVCRLWPPLDSPLAVSVVLSPQELRAASNSARLCALWLSRSTLHVRGQQGLTEPAQLVARPDSAVLFPGGPERRPLPRQLRHLIVPDGTWSQARRIERRWFAAHALPRVELDPGLPSAYALRRGGRGLCTFEAIAIAIGLTKDPALARVLLQRFAEWARRARWLKAGGPAPGTLLASSDELAEHPAAALFTARSPGG